MTTLSRRGRIRVHDVIEMVDESADADFAAKEVIGGGIHARFLNSFVHN